MAATTVFNLLLQDNEPIKTHGGVYLLPISRDLDTHVQCELQNMTVDKIKFYFKNQWIGYMVNWCQGK